ncbi:putative ribonuclease H-like domain-containing protein, partial [Tanacetum coccineum]
ERKARTTLLLALPEDHLAKFHKMTDAKEMCDAIKSRFGGNDESNKMHKFQSLLSQLEIHGAGVSTKDANQKFLRFLPSAWSRVALVMRTKPGVDNLSFDDLYNNLMVFDTNDVSTAFVGSTTSGNNSQKEFPSSSSLLANQSSCPQLDHEDLEQLDEFDLEEMDLKWQVAMISMSLKKFHNKSRRKIQFDAKEPVGFDKTKVECYNCHKIGHFARECRSKRNQDNKRKDAWNSGYIAKDNGRRPGKQEESNALITLDGEGIDWTAHVEDEEDNFALMAFSNSSSDNKAYTEALKKVEAQLVAYQQNQLWYEEKIGFMKVDLDDKIDVLTYHKKLLAEALKEKEELKTKLGYRDHRYGSILSYENEVLQSVFMNKESDTENQPLYDRFATAEGMHVVPLPMSGNYMPSGPDIEIDYSKFTYGLKQSQTSESETQTSDFATCKSNSSVETLESVPDLVVNEPKVVSQPKVWSDAPIIEEYKLDSDNDCVFTPSKGQEKPSFAFENTSKQVKTPKEPVKEQQSYSKSSKVDKRDWNGAMSQKLGWGYGFTRKACFVYGSYSHLIRDYDFHEKRMAKQEELNKRVCKGTSLRENRPVWNNVQKVNHQNQFVPTAVLTRTGNIPVNIARQNFLKQAVPRKVNNARRNFVHVLPKMNENDVYKRQNVFKRSHLPVKRPFQNKTVTNNMIWKSKANTSNANHVNSVGSQAVVNTAKGYKGPIAFGGSKGYITGKGKIKTGKLDFEDVSFVKELQQFNIFSISQMCDKRNKVLFTDTECLVLSPEFKLPDENQGNLVRGLPSKVFQNDHTCVACQKGKLHKASCKAKSVSFISQPLQLLHMDLFGPTSVRSINHKTYCLVIADDFSRVLVTKPQNKTPYELITGKIPIISYIRPFGCHVTILNTIDHLGKFEEKADESFLVWYSLSSKAFRVYNLETKRVEENPHVQFLENKPNVAGKGPTWLFDLDYLIDSMNYLPVRLENQANITVGPKETNHSAELKKLKRQEKEAIDVAEALRKEIAQGTEDLLHQTGDARASDDSQIPALEDIYGTLEDGLFTNASYNDQGVVTDFTNLETFVEVSPISKSRIHYIYPTSQILGDPKSAVQTKRKVDKGLAHALIEPKKIYEALEEESWVDAMQEELLQFKLQKVWILVDLPSGKKAIGTKWIYMNKKDERGVVVRNKARIESIVIFLAFASYMGFIVYQMDVKSAFLYGTIDEEVYVSQPLGFMDPKHPKKVYKVVKALYGLHQAPRAWYATLSTFLEQSGYRRGTIDKTLFIKKDRKDIMLVQVYVDDIIFGSTKKSWCDEFEALIKNKFQMSSMGELTFFLGLQVKQKENGFFISQDKYVGEILKKFDLMSVKHASTPIETHKPLVKDEGATDVDVHLYRSMIGSLMYLTASRPDIMFAVCACRRFQVTPKTSHLHAVKRIFRYLKGKPKLGLWYPRESSFDLVAYSDSDYGGANLDMKSTTGGYRESLERDIDGTKALLLPNLLNFSLTKVSTDNAILVPLGKDSTAKEPLKIIPPRFWKTTTSKTINNVRYITAKVADKPVSISEASIRSDLQFNDAVGIDVLPNQVIFDTIQLMGYEGDLTILTFNKAMFSPQWKFLFHTMNYCLSSKSTSWDQIPINIETAVICLATNQVYNFSKLIFDGMLRHLDATKKFVMYPRFISIFLGKQLKNVPIPLDHFPINALTTKVFSFMVKKGKNFSGNMTPLFSFMLAQPTKDEGEASKRPSETQPTPSPTQPSADQIEPPIDSSPRPLPSIPILDPIRESFRRNHGCQSSSDRSLSGNEDGLTLQSVYDCFLSLCTHVTAQAKEIKALKAQIKKLQRRAKPGRKSAKAEPTVHKDPAFDNLDDTLDDFATMDYMETDAYNEEGVSTEDKVSTDKPKVSTDKAKGDDGTAETRAGQSDTPTTQTTTPTLTLTIFGDDETIAQVLLNMSQAKAVLKEKEKGVKLKDVEDIERPRATSTRSVLTLKPLPKIDPKDKGKKVLEEEAESDVESEGVTEAEKKFKQVANDEEVARKFTVKERAKFLHDTIAAQRIFLAQQRSGAIRSKPPIRNQLRNQMMTYLKHVGNKKHVDLKTKSFEEIKVLYEKIKRFDNSFIVVGSTKDERKVKEMNEEAGDSKKKKVVKEEDTTKVHAKQDVTEQEVDSDDEQRKCLRITALDSTIDSEVMETKSVIAKLYKVSSPDGDYLVVYRANGNFWAFNYLMEVLHIFDRQDLFHLYDLVMKQYSEITLEGIELIL